MSKDEFRSIDLLGGMHLNGNAVAVVFNCHSKDTLYESTGDIDVLDGRLALLRRTTNKGISCIHYNLIENLVKSRVEAQGAVYHLLGCIIIDPTSLINCLCASDIRIRKFKDMLAMSVLLILVSHDSMIFLLVYQYPPLGFQICTAAFAGLACLAAFACLSTIASTFATGCSSHGHGLHHLLLRHHHRLHH